MLLATASISHTHTYLRNLFWILLNLNFSFKIKKKVILSVRWITRHQSLLFFNHPGAKANESNLQQSIVVLPYTPKTIASLNTF